MIISMQSNLYHTYLYSRKVLSHPSVTMDLKETILYRSAMCATRLWNGLPYIALVLIFFRLFGGNISQYPVKKVVALR